MAKKNPDPAAPPAPPYEPTAEEITAKVAASHNALDRKQAAEVLKRQRAAEEAAE